MACLFLQVTCHGELHENRLKASLCRSGCEWTRRMPRPPSFVTAAGYEALGANPWARGRLRGALVAPRVRHLGRSAEQRAALHPGVEPERFSVRFPVPGGVASTASLASLVDDEVGHSDHLLFLDIKHSEYLQVVVDKLFACYSAPTTGIILFELAFRSQSARIGGGRERDSARVHIYEVLINQEALLSLSIALNTLSWNAIHSSFDTIPSLLVSITCIISI